MADVKIETVRCGSFYATFLSGDKGDVYRWHADEHIARSDVAMRKLVVRGELEMIEKPEACAAWPVERAGADGAQLPDIAPGEYCVRCNEDDTLWILACAMTEESPAPFQSGVHDVVAGLTIELPVGGVLVVGCGKLFAAGREIVGPTAVHARSGPLTLLVVERVLAVSAWR